MNDETNENGGAGAAVADVTPQRASAAAPRRRRVSDEVLAKALREVRAVEKKHAERMDGLEKRVQGVEQASASVAGELKQMNNRLSDIWNFLTKK